MPEIKHTFTSGKMNKDFDERLVANGEYRDAMNIQVSTSEGSDVGTVQNILGNKKVDGQGEIFPDAAVGPQASGNLIPENPTCVGAVVDESNDTLYWFLASDNKDVILQLKNQASSSANKKLITTVLVDVNKNTLKFDPNKIITGINIIDGMLIWTDNINEPKKINIQRCIDGTNSVAVQTRLINESQNIDLSSNIEIEEKHITVIKKSPSISPKLELQSERFNTQGKVYTAVMKITGPFAGTSNNSSFYSSTTTPTRYDFSSISLGQELFVELETDVNGNSSFRLDWEVGDIILIKEFIGNNAPATPMTNYRIKAKITSFNSTDNRVKFEILAINGTPPSVAQGQTELKYAIDKQDDEENLYEFKFPRFATRYKYEDGEYSAFSPFTQVAFLPGAFDYHPKKGYNLAMTNRLKKVIVKSYALRQHTPSDVVSIDILYKEEGSNNVYVVDSIKSADWGNDYVIESETISRVLPENQLLRPWDNVPRTALAQDIVGNRVVYGNYTQGYDLLNIDNLDYNLDANFSFVNNDVSSAYNKSIKSLREYQLGVVFVDKYGRETSVISKSKNTKKLNKIFSDKANAINVAFNDTRYMKDMKYFKFYIKETSSEYYNLAMDRFWDADDGHVWVSFPSSDRNKLTIDDFLILKKGVESNTLVEDPARYKVLAIENEAPDFIKTKKTLIEEKTHIFASSNIFGNTLTSAPISGRDYFDMIYEEFADSSGADLDKITDGDLYVEFGQVGQGFRSERYRIAEIRGNFRTTTTPSTRIYSIKLDTALGEDVDFIENGGSIIDDAIVNIYKYKVENSPQFDGRFFVKLLKDDIFTSNITNNVGRDSDYRVIASQKLYYMNGATHNTTHQRSRTGLGDQSSSAVYGATGPFTNDFGKFAPFFRDYTAGNSTSTNSVASRYAFGNDKNDSNGNWRKEFDLINSTSYSSFNTITDLKKADKTAIDEKVWFIDGGNFKASTNGNDLDWTNINTTPGTNVGILESTTPGSTSSLNLALGGIFDEFVCGFPTFTKINEYFNIGKNNGNSNYQDNNTITFVEQINPARKFWFKEDPNKNIYTIQPTIPEQQLLRYSHGNYPSPLANIAPLQVVDNDAQLSPNFTKNWNLRIQNESGDGTIAWNPVGALGPITGGVDITLTGENGGLINNGQNTFNARIKLSTLTAIDLTTGVNYTIQEDEPLILTSYVDASGTETLNGTGTTQPLLVDKITQVGGDYIIDLVGYESILTNGHKIFTDLPVSGSMTFRQPTMNGYSQFSANRINMHSQAASLTNPQLGAVGYTIEFIDSIELEGELPDNPAVWETEPKDLVDLDVYYEASSLNPINLTDDVLELAIPIGANVTGTVGTGATSTPGSLPVGTTVANITSSGSLTLNATSSSWAVDITTDDKIKIEKPDGSYINCKVIKTPIASAPSTIVISPELYGPNTTYDLNWHNCYSFGNGVESNRIRDNFNLPYILNGVKVSTTLEEGDYKEEHRKYGLIYSGLYNNVSGINNLNQFIAAEKITKDINPIYGSIQKLHTRDTDLVTLCEDKVLKILARKDAIYNADGNPQLTATENVLGQSIPFSGEYGISKNPESFASENYRVYFTDKVRGAVMRLSMDGLTPISDHGMKDWFRDNLKLGNKKLLGSYDDSKNNYNLTIVGDILDNKISTTVSFSEHVRGWVSFKSFIPQHAISMANEYYTICDEDWIDKDSNTFYGNYTNSTIDVLLNDMPSNIKSYHTLEYEGTQSKTSIDGAFSGLGWYVSTIETDKEKGSLKEFIEKEGKWFNYIKGINESINANTDFAISSIQGIGILGKVSGGDTLVFTSYINMSLQVGDVIYFQTPNTSGNFTTIDTDTIQEFGTVSEITDYTVTVSAVVNTPSQGDYILFAKDRLVNTSSLRGYFASAKFENDSKEYAELFAVSSEITESSK